MNIMKFMKKATLFVFVLRLDLIVSYQKFRSNIAKSNNAGGQFISPRFFIYRHQPQTSLRSQPRLGSICPTPRLLQKLRASSTRSNVVVNQSTPSSLQKTKPSAELNNTLVFNASYSNNETGCGSANFTSRTGRRSKSLLFKKFRNAMNVFDKQFYNSSFTILTANSPESRRHNGVSFVLSGMFLYLALLALSHTVDDDTRRQMRKFHVDAFIEEETIELLKSITSWLPGSNSEFRFRWSTRLMLRKDTTLDATFTEGLAPALKLKTDHFNSSDDVNEVAEVLNRMVEADSGGALRDTFDPEDVSDGVKDVLLSTLYFRCRWRTPPTLLNGTMTFRDQTDSNRTTPMFRVNDIIHYTVLDEWDAEVIELSFSVEGLSLLLMVPRRASLGELATRLAAEGVPRTLRRRMHALRAAVSLPLYTLRMTLLLPNKMRELGISRMFPESVATATNTSELRFTQAVQRIMFWSEAGRNAFKDDGIEWDEPPDMNIVVDRPYIFFVRWKNITIISGNFVL